MPARPILPSINALVIRVVACTIGATISAGLFRGFDRVAAARYSFLLSVPAVVLSGLFELRKVGAAGGPSAGATAIATAIASVRGYAAIAGLILSGNPGIAPAEVNWGGLHFKLYFQVAAIGMMALGTGAFLLWSRRLGRWPFAITHPLSQSAD